MLEVLVLFAVAALLLAYALRAWRPWSMLQAPEKSTEHAASGEATVAPRPASWSKYIDTSTRTFRETRLLALISLGAAALYYLPFWLRLPSIGGIPFQKQGMDAIYGMWDGPLWITAAGTLWDPNRHNPIYLGLKPSELAERSPLFPLAVHAVSPVLGYWAGALVINVLASTAVTLLLYLFLRRYGTLPNAAFWAALISIFWPPRGFLYRYVIMSEPLFILSTLAAVYCYRRRRYDLCGVCGALAVAARPNGFLVALAFGLIAAGTVLSLRRQGRLREARPLAWLLLMPLTLAAIMLWHQHLFGDWLAAYHSGAFVKPQAALYPFLSFFQLGEEGTSYVFLLVLAGIIELARRRQWDLVILSALFYLPLLFVSTDVDRYLLPILPFAFFLAGERVLASKPVRIALLLSIPMIYTYAWSTMISIGYQADPGPFHALLNMLP